MNEMWEQLPRRLRGNPFFHFSAIGRFIPAWDRITLDDAMPALEYAFRLAKKNIRAVIENKDPPTYENVIEAIQTADELRRYFSVIVDNHVPNTAQEQRRFDILKGKIERRELELFDGEYLTNKKLYERVLQVGLSPQFAELPEEKKRLWQSTQQKFLDYGVKLSDKNKEKFDVLSARILRLTRRMQRNMARAERDSVVFVKNPKRLRGLSDEQVRDAAALARRRHRYGQWALQITDATYNKLLDNIEDPALQRRLWRTYHTQCAHGRNDNREVRLELLHAEYEQVRMLGYKNMAEYLLRDTATRTPENAMRFVSHVKRAALPFAKKELAELKEFAKARDGVELEPWNEPYYATLLKQQRLGFSEQDLMPYFELEYVLKGTLEYLENMHRIRFVPLKDAPIYDPGVRAYELRDIATGAALSTLFLDLYHRDFKQQYIAQCSPILSQGLFQGKVRRPVSIVTMKLASGKPTLLWHKDVKDLLHEIGHEVHESLSNCRYHEFAGMNIAPEFCEFPSQFLEAMAYDADFLDKIARHHLTKAKMPVELRDAIVRSRSFRAGSVNLNQMAECWIDLTMYRANPAKIESLTAFEKTKLESFHLLPTYNAAVLPRFNNDGYEGKHWIYPFGEAVGADAFAFVKEKGICSDFTRRGLRHVFAKSGSCDGFELYEGFRGQPASTQAFLDRYELLGPAFNLVATNQSLPRVSDLAKAAAPSVH